MIDKNPDFDSMPTASATERRRANTVFQSICIVVAAISVVILIVLIGSIVSNGYGVLSWNFVTGPPTKEAATAGIGPALMGTVWACVICAAVVMPIGVCTAIFLEEYTPKNPTVRLFHSFVQLNISNLAGVPSIVYGLLGLTAFASMYGLFGLASDPALEIGATHLRQYITEANNVVFIPIENRKEIPNLKNGMTAFTGDGEEVSLKIIGDGEPYPSDDQLAYSLFYDNEGSTVTRKSWYYFRLPFGRSVLTAGLTLMLVVLPIIIIASQESLRSVPGSLREGAMGLGATQWQVIRNVTLPAAIPGIMTGSILSTSRAIGEAAPIVIIAGVVYIRQSPSHLMDNFSILPLQIFYWAGQPNKEGAEVTWQEVAAGGSIVLLAILLSFNAVAIAIRQWMNKPLT